MGEKIKKLRMLHRITQKELSEKTDIPARYISDIENGYRTNENEYKLLLSALCVDFSPNDSEKIYELERNRLIVEKLNSKQLSTLNNVAEMLIK